MLNQFFGGQAWKYISLLLLLLSFHPYSLSQTNWIVKQSLFFPDPKRDDWGVGAIFLNIKQDNVSIIIRKIRDSIVAQNASAADIKFTGDSIEIDLSSFEDVAFVNLPEGSYQIIQVNVPHFNLPYKISTDNEKTWRFNVVANKINYLGTMKVGAVRRKDVIDTVWLNQYATHFEQLTSLASQVNSDWEILQGIGYKDEFHALLNGESDE